MDKDLKALFEACSVPPREGSLVPPLREEAYDSFNEETFGNSMETWEQSESFESGSTLTTSNGSEAEADSASLKEKDLGVDEDVDEASGASSRRAAGVVDDNDQDKDNMDYLIDSTLSHLGLLTKQMQVTGDVKKTFENSQRVNEPLEGLSGEINDYLDHLRADPEEWPLSKQKTQEGSWEVMSRSLHQQRPELDSEEDPTHREPYSQIALERGDADRVIIGAGASMLSPRRGSGRFDVGRYERGNGHFCRRFNGPNAIGHGGSSTSSSQGGNAPLRPENFDLRNVETFGIDAVQQHIQDHNPNNGANSGSNGNGGGNGGTNNNNSNGSSSHCHYGNGTSGPGGHSSYPLSVVARGSRNCSRYDGGGEDGPSSNSGGFSNDRGVRARLPEIRDPRMYDFYMELWQRMQQEAAAEENNAAANNSGNIHSHLGNVYSHGTGGGSNSYSLQNGGNDSRSDGGQRRSIDQRMGDVQFEAQMTELKHKVWEQLELAAELGPIIEVMEDVVDRLVDPTEPPSTEDRLTALRKLADNVSPDNVCNLVRLVHSRRLLMYTLAHLWSELSLRDHALELFSTMLSRLDTLLVSDGSDMVFSQKREVFMRIFNGCTMEQLISLTTCLLKSPTMAVGSRLGLFFIGRILECAENVELSNVPSHWVDKCLPKILQHLVRVQRAELLHEIVGARALKYIFDNMDNVSIMRTVHAANAQSANTTSY